ncbi:hypothetical protein CRG98_005065 [Punica granatum]|uniref:Retrotransposon gag domain-containing protein n=1 Tax=Punica granatum TaxID=22663 RepID=A0A2I0L1L1_PUNGR|nr:hypothetical protein CRG98_005065 [Punica granatum]
MFLVYGGEEELVVRGYTNASFQSDKDDSRSQSGYMFCLNGGTVSWKSSNQETVADSTIEAEYIAASNAAKEAVWIKKFVTELAVVPGSADPVDLYCDKQWSHCTALAASIADLEVLSRKSVWIPVEASRLRRSVDGLKDSRSSPTQRSHYTWGPTPCSSITGSNVPFTERAVEFSFWYFSKLTVVATPSHTCPSRISWKVDTPKPRDSVACMRAPTRTHSGAPSVYLPPLATPSTSAGLVPPSYVPPSMYKPPTPMPLVSPSSNDAIRIVALEGTVNQMASDITELMEYEQFMIQTFQESLKGVALSWFTSLKAADIPTWDELAKKFVSQYGYNTDIAPSYLELSVMEMQEEQSFEDYVIQWHAEVAKHRPPINEAKQIQIFHGTLKGAYYSHLLGHMSSFNMMIKAGKKAPGFKNSSAGLAGLNPTSPARKIIPKTPNANINPANQDQSLHCEYHMGAPRHMTDSCYVLKGKLQALIDKKLLSFNEVKPPNVQANPLPDHGSNSDLTINMIGANPLEKDKTKEE